MEGRWEIELCSDCAAGRSTRPLVECQHIGPDDAGPVFSVVPCDDAAIRRASEAALAEMLRLLATDDLDPERRGDESPEAFVARKAMEAGFRAAGETS